MRNKSRPKQEEQSSSNHQGSSVNSGTSGTSQSSSDASGIESSVDLSKQSYSSQPSLSQKDHNKNFKKSFSSAKKLSNQVENTHQRSVSKMASRYLESTISDNESLDSQSEISQKMVNVVNPLHKQILNDHDSDQNDKLKTFKNLKESFNKQQNFLKEQESLINEMKSTRESQFLENNNPSSLIRQTAEEIKETVVKKKQTEFERQSIVETKFIIEIQNQAEERSKLQNQLIQIERELKKEANRQQNLNKKEIHESYGQKEKEKGNSSSVYSSQTVKAEQTKQLTHESEQVQVQNGSEAVFLRKKLKDANNITDKFMIILDKLKDVNMRFDDSHEKKSNVNKEINEQKAKLKQFNLFGKENAYLAQQKAPQIQAPQQDHLNHMPDYQHVFTTEGGISNNTWTAEGGGGPEGENDDPVDDQPTLTGVEAQIKQRPSLYADCQFDVFKEMKEDDVWSNPINIIKKPVKLRKIEKSRKETIVSLPTLSKEQAERVKKYEESLEKNKNKEYKYTFDDQIQRLDDANNNDDQVKKSDEEKGPVDDLDPNSFINPLRAQFLEYNDLEQNTELIIKEYPRKINAFYFVERKTAQYSDGIEHFSAEWLKIPPGQRKAEMMRGLLNEFLDEDQQIEEMQQKEHQQQTASADKLYETDSNSQEEQLYALDSPSPFTGRKEQLGIKSPLFQKKNTSGITIERLDDDPITPYIRQNPTSTSVTKHNKIQNSARKRIAHRLDSQETFDQQSQQYLNEGRPDLAIEMLIASIRQYEDVLYFKQYHDLNEKNKIKQIINQLRNQLDSLSQGDDIDELQEDEQNSLGKFQLVKMDTNLRDTKESLLFNQDELQKKPSQQELGIQITENSGKKIKSPIKAPAVSQPSKKLETGSLSQFKAQNFRDPELIIDQDEDEDEEELDVEAMKIKIKKYKQRLREKEILEGRNTGSIYQTSNGSSISLLSDLPKKKLRKDIGKVLMERKLSFKNPDVAEITPTLLSNMKSKVQKMYSPANEYEQPPQMNSKAQVEANVVTIFNHYSKKKVMPNKSDKVFADIGEENSYMQLPGFSAFCKEILDKVLKLPVKKRSEIYKKTCVDSKQIMSLDQFKQSLTRIAREHNRQMLQQHKKDIGELKQEISNMVDGPNDDEFADNEIARAPTLEAIPEDLDEDYYEESPDFRKQQEAKLQKELEEIEKLESSIRTQLKQNSNIERDELLERKQILTDQISDLLEQNANQSYLYDLITVEILNLDRPLTQINLLYQTQIKEQTLEEKRGSSLQKSPSSLSKTKRSTTSSRTVSRLEDPKQKYQEMTQTQREFLRKKHQVMRDILNKSEHSGSSKQLTSENLTEFDRQLEDSRADSKLSKRSDFNQVENPYMNTEDEEWFTQKLKPSQLKSSNLTLFMKENLRNQNQAKNIHDHYANLKQATGPKNPYANSHGQIASFKMQSKHGKVDLVPLNQTMDLQVKANIYQQQLETEQYLKDIIQDYSSDENNESLMGIGESIESLKFKQKTPLKDVQKPPLGVNSQPVMKQRYQQPNKGRNIQKLEPLNTQLSIPSSKKSKFEKHSKSVQPQRTISNGRNNQEMSQYQAINAYNLPNSIQKGADSQKRGSLPQISPSNQARSYANMPNPSRYARSSRNKSPLISTNDMKLPEIAPTQNSQSPKRETSTLIPPQNYGKQNTVVKSQHHHTDFRTTETRNFRITRNKGNLEYKLGKKNAFEPDQNQVVVKAKLQSSIHGQMTNSKERFNDGKVKVTAKRKIKANFGMVDTNMQKIGTYGYEGFVQANEDPYQVEQTRQQSPRNFNPFTGSLQQSKEIKKRY